jgi:hypothetical protein
MKTPRICGETFSSASSSEEGRKIAHRLPGHLLEDPVVHRHGHRIVSPVQRVGLSEGPSRLLVLPEPLENQTQVVEGVGRLGVEPHGVLEVTAGLLEASELEGDLTLEGAVDRHLTDGLAGPPDQEPRTFEVVQIEESLRLEVVDLRLGAAIWAGQVGISREQQVALGDGLIELTELLDQKLRAVELRSHELRIGHGGELDLVECFVDPPFVPQDLAATIVSFGTIRVCLQRLVEPGERFLGAPAVGGLHRLIQAIPVSIPVLHVRAAE